MEVRTMGQQPEKTFRQGAVSASIFKNGMSRNGKSFDVFKVSLQRAYKDKDDQWQNTGSLGLNDLPKAAIALTKAYDYLTARQKEGEE